MNADEGRKETDKLLAQMERKVKKEYRQASKEVEEKLQKYLAAFEKKDKQKQAERDEGIISEEDYQKWRTGQIMIGKRWSEMKDSLAQDYHNANNIAKSIVSGYMPEVYAINHNYGTFEVEKESQLDTSYTLYDRQTVERLMRDNPDMLPPPGKNTSQKIKDKKETRWNKQKIQSVMTQSLLQGESIPKIAKRLAEKVGDSNYKAAIRNARTMTTGAENAGRVDSYKRAQDMGIEMQQQWIATLDGRTRDSHAAMDGEVIDVGGVFSNGCRFPGDPHGRPEEVYNCRCAMVAQLKGFETDASDMSLRNSSKLGNMSYEEWKNEHITASKEKEFKLIGGKNSAEITDSIYDYYLPSATKKKLEKISDLGTYGQFVEYFAKQGITLETELDKLKERKDDVIPNVQDLLQKIAVAVDTYQETFGSNALSALQKIVLYDQELDVRAAYFFNLVGENDPRAGEIAFRDWTSKGRDVFHEMAHALQDSFKREGEDCISFSNRIAENVKIPNAAYKGTSGLDEENAEMMAEAIAFGFTQGIVKDVDFIKRLRDFLKNGRR